MTWIVEKRHLRDAKWKFWEKWHFIFSGSIILRAKILSWERSSLILHQLYHFFWGGPLFDKNRRSGNSIGIKRKKPIVFSILNQKYLIKLPIVLYTFYKKPQICLIKTCLYLLLFVVVFTKNVLYLFWKHA